MSPSASSRSREALYLQLVGATTNKPDAVSEPNAAVCTVLSGVFDRLPLTPQETV